jgi:hypothetical protein
MTLAGILALFLCLCEPEPRYVNVTVHVADSNGAPVTGVPLSVCDPVEDTYVETDSVGALTIRKAVPLQCRWIAIVPAWELRKPGESEAARKSRRAANMAIFSKFAFSNHYRIDLVDGQADYTLRIAVPSARVVTLRVLQAGLPLRSAYVLQWHGFLGEMPDEQGVVRLHGVRRLEEDVFVTASGQAVRLHVPPGELDVDLKEVHIKPIPNECIAAITMLNWKKLDQTVDAVVPGVTLISSDGNKIVDLFATRTKSASTTMVYRAGGIHGH